MHICISRAKKGDFTAEIAETAEKTQRRERKGERQRF
jgi:hypothetical protein